MNGRVASGKNWKKILKFKAKPSGIHTDTSELETLLEEIIEKEDAAEDIQEKE